ncbi:MAG: N-formylglutamate amidohydrolase [Jannaschia sp.]
MSESVNILNVDGRSSVVLVCEHASHRIPERMNDLGLSAEARLSHAAWDPGAMAVADRLSERLDAVLVAATVSRLVYDCNRPPDAPDAMPSRSEVIDIPGNVGLTTAERAARTAAYYEPFRAALSDTIDRTDNPVIVTIHSFTPVFHGRRRTTEIGVLHDADARLADAMLRTAAGHLPYLVEANQPYGPADGVTHTLREHALPQGHANVMLEIRSDLIADAAAQDRMAGLIAPWLVEAFARTHAKGSVRCLA